MTKPNDHIAAAVADAVATVRRENVEIVTLCALAGRPELAAQMILDGASVAAARKRLEALAVAQPVKRPGGGNGSAFDVAAVESVLAAKTTAPQ